MTSYNPVPLAKPRRGQVTHRVTATHHRPRLSAGSANESGSWLVSDDDASWCSGLNVWCARNYVCHVSDGNVTWPCTQLERAASDHACLTYGDDLVTCVVTCDDLVTCVVTCDDLVTCVVTLTAAGSVTCDGSVTGGDQVTRDGSVTGAGTVTDVGSGSYCVTYAAA